MLHIFYPRVASVLCRCCIFNERFECSMQYETYVAAGFFLIIYGWITIFFDLLLMLQTLIFDVAYGEFSMLQMIFLNIAWTVRWKMFPSDVRDASSAVKFLDDRKILFATPGQMTLEFTSIPRHEDPILSY